MKTRSTFEDAGWDFDADWSIDLNYNDGYPRLRDFEYPEQPVVSNVAITGGLVVGQELTATYTYSGPTGSTEEGTAFQWFRWTISPTNIGDRTKSAIDGANALTYTTTEDDMY